MPGSTRATLALGNLGVRFTLHTYVYDPHAERIGLQAADALGVEARRVLKTLMAEVDGKPVCVIIPADREVSMKKLAAAFHGKTARMMPAADAERLTGYHVGGISPFAQKARAGRDRANALGRPASTSTADSAACRSSLRRTMRDGTWGDCGGAGGVNERCEHSAARAWSQCINAIDACSKSVSGP